MFIGLDLGTSHLKGIVIDDAQNVCAEASVSLSLMRPKNGWSEQNPQDWLDATENVMASLANKVNLKKVNAIGLSGQMHGATLLDKNDNVLRPCILWNDTRSAEEASYLDSKTIFRNLTGNIVFPGFTAPKLAWVRKHEPNIFAKISKVLLPKDYLRLWLCGEYVAEMSDAAGTSWLDVKRRDWSDALLAETDLDRSQMPTLIEGCEISGVLKKTHASKWGLPHGVIIAGGGGDNAASAIGVGVVKAGDAFVSLGTSGVLFAASDEYQPDAASAVHTFCHALPNTWHQMGVILAATDAMNWFGQVLNSSAQEMTNDLGVLKAPSKTLFLPYLGGERTPHNDAQIRASFINLDHNADRQAMIRAVIEGVAFAFRDCFDALSSTGTKINQLVAVGGGAKSEYWVQAIATTLGLPISIPVAGDHGGAFGAARLGMIAYGINRYDVAISPKIKHIIEPVMSLHDDYLSALKSYRETYKVLKAIG
ncbi:xylulokinase [Amylibacter sp.]|nr:xylulokinase [Amylibacter sp.]MDB2600761.1 xylulokinase [Amylibacter sp.]